MFIPVAFAISPVTPENWLSLHFLQMIDFAAKNQFPVISHQHYFDLLSDGEQCNRIMQNSDVFHISTDFTELDFDPSLQIGIPIEIEKRFISKFPSETDAFISSVIDDWSEIEDFIFNALKSLLTDKEAKAFISFNSNKFLNNISQRIGCSVINYELSAIREPNYNQTLYYFDFKGHYGNSSSSEKYKSYMADDHSKCTILTRKELLGLFLQNKDIDYLNYIDSDAPYEAGVASKGLTISGSFSSNKVNDAEMVQRAIKVFGKKNILYKPRFAHVYGEVLEAAWGEIDVHNENLFDFLVKSKRVICAGSNTSLDAALFGKIVYDVGFSHNAMISNDKLELLDDSKPSDENLSFIVFSTLVPVELFWEKEYLDYRMKNPSEVELYLYHMKYQLEKLGLEEVFFVMSSVDRLKSILEKRCIDYKQLFDQTVSPIHRDSERLCSRWVYDCGEGFSYENTIDSSGWHDSNSILYQNITLPKGCKAVRWYPASSPCIIDSYKFKNEAGTLFDVLAHNGRKIGDSGKTTFYTDSFIEVDTKLQNSEIIYVEAEIRRLSGIECIQQENNVLLEVLSAMEMSKSWRITAPLRKIMKIMHKNHS